MRIIGIGGLDHNGSICVVRGGEIVVFLELERVTRVKNQGLDSPNALALLADHLGVDDGVDQVAVADRTWFRERRWLRDFVASRWPEAVLTVHGHHECHLAAAFATSPFEEATAVSIDGKGDGLSAAAGRLTRGGPVDPVLSVPSAHSLGRLWWALCDFVGLPGHHSAGKAMALAAYGEPQYLQALLTRCRVGADGGFRFVAEGEHPDLFRQVPRLVEWMSRLASTPAAAREPAQAHMNMAASVQVLTERLVVALCTEAVARTGVSSICLAGGVALNGLANQRVLEAGAASALHVTFVTDDRGLSVGAAAIAAGACAEPVRAAAVSASPYLGPVPASAGAEHASFHCGAREPEVVAVAARLIAAGRVVAWFEGPDEAGPRALGNRSLLASPAFPWMRDHLNRVVKRREWFRPYGCSVSSVHAPLWFVTDVPSPYMLRIVRVRPERRAAIPSAVHQDGTARIHTVTAESHRRLTALLSALEALGEPPLVLNTSLNRPGDPMAHSADDALAVAAECAVDAIVVGDRLLIRSVPT